MSHNPHISEQYESELEHARNLFMEMGGMVEQQLRDACRALATHDVELAQSVRDIDDRVNKLEVELNELCVHIIALRQPAATDLRALISILKASADLERIGDESCRIAKTAIAVAPMEFPADRYSDVGNLAAETTAMLKDTLDVFARIDDVQALSLIESDVKINEGYDAILRQRSNQMIEQPEQIERALNVIWAARALERIGDHAKNINESTVFLARGEDVRYHRVSDVQTPAD